MEKKIYQQPHAKLIEFTYSSLLYGDSNVGNENPGGGSGASLDLKFEEEAVTEGE